MFGSCFIVSTLAIADGVMNNDAFKHCKGEDKNKNQITIVKDLKLFENMDDHAMYSFWGKRFWVEVLLVHNTWKWGVSNSLHKANFAPKILIKCIAHQLNIHIIVFDLKLNSVQFLYGNHVRINNVVFDSLL